MVFPGAARHKRLPSVAFSAELVPSSPVQMPSPLVSPVTPQAMSEGRPAMERPMAGRLNVPG